MGAIANKAKITPNLPATVDEELARELEALKTRIAAPTGDVISLTRDKTFKMPDQTEAQALSVIVVDFTNYFAFFDAQWDPKNFRPPACHAVGVNLNELVPADNSPVKQHTDCATCPQNQWKSAGSGKACKNQRMLALLPPGNQANGPLMILKVPPAALRFFDKYVTSIAAQHSAPLLKVITEITMDPAAEYASPRFAFQGVNQDWEIAFSRRKEAHSRLSVIPDLSGYTPPPAGRR